MIFENCGSSPEIKNLGRIGLKIAMCSNFYEIWHLLQIEHANMNVILGTDGFNSKL